MKKTMFATMTILSLFLSSCAQKEVKNEDKKEQSTEQNVKDSTKERYTAVPAVKMIQQQRRNSFLIMDTGVQRREAPGLMNIQ